MSVTGSVVALKYKDGVIIGTDTQLHNGNAKHTNVNRHFKIGENTTVATGGYWSDTQFLIEDLYELEKEDALYDDGHTKSAKHVHAYLKLVLYNKRCDFKPAMATVVVAGKEKGSEPFLGWVDSVGTFADVDMFATGIGEYMCVPLLRAAAEDGKWRDLTYEAAKKVVDTCLSILFVRAKPQFARVLISKTSDEGQELVGPYVVSAEGTTRGVIEDQQPFY